MCEKLTAARFNRAYAWLRLYAFLAIAFESLRAYCEASHLENLDGRSQHISTSSVLIGNA